jgi:3-deoxy-D-manno-octulosonic-acid transferase
MLGTYRFLTFILYPFFITLIYLRSIFNKEDKLRFKEKIFSTAFNIKRDRNRKLIWFHAASIGEALSILPLVEKINNLNKNIDFLITTVTLSSAKLLKKKLTKHNCVVHRYFPLDIERLTEKFLDGWEPDLICFVDSEIWPNFLFKIKEKNIPLILINGRITKKTFKKWNMFPVFAKKVFNNFDLCLPCSIESKKNLKMLQVTKISHIGNLKFSARPEKERFNESDTKTLDAFKVWCAASTHKEEEVVAIKTHLKIKKKFNNVLTVIIPRHVNRTSHIKKITAKFNLNTQILNDKDVIKNDIEILIINSFGVLFKYFNYCKNIFIGKSLIERLKYNGGQNPIEAAKLNCTIYFGPYVYNFQEIYDFLKINNMAEQINNEHDLSDKIIESFEKTKVIDYQNINLLNNYGEKILQDTVTELEKFIKIKNENLKT